MGSNPKSAGRDPSSFSGFTRKGIDSDISTFRARDVRWVVAEGAKAAAHAIREARHNDRNILIRELFSKLISSITSTVVNLAKSRFNSSFYSKFSINDEVFSSKSSSIISEFIFTNFRHSRLGNLV